MRHGGLCPCEIRLLYWLAKPEPAAWLPVLADGRHVMYLVVIVYYIYGFRRVHGIQIVNWALSRLAAYSGPVPKKKV